MKRLILLLILFVNLQIVITHEDMQLFSYSTASAQHMTKEAGDNCYDEYDHLWYHVDVAFDCNDYGTVSTPCRYCLKEFGSDEQAISERDRHEYECGRTLVGCIFCGAMVQRQEMEIHCAFSCPYWQNVFNDPNSEYKSWEEWKNKHGNLTGGGTTSSGGGTSVTYNQGHLFSVSLPVPQTTPINKMGAAIAGYSYGDENSHKYKTYFFQRRWDDLSRTTKAELEARGVFMNNFMTGFKATMLEKRSVDGKRVVAYVCSFAGTDTDLSFIQDASADARNLLGFITEQYVQAMYNAIAISEYCKEKDIPLIFVGHSLGGGLAALASMVTGRIAITYNPAGALGLLMTVLKKYFPIDTSHIYAYIMNGDPVTNWQGLLGVHAEGQIINVPNNIGGSPHSIENMFNNLK